MRLERFLPQPGALKKEGLHNYNRVPDALRMYRRVP
jgi:hypothetical protein